MSGLASVSVPRPGADTVDAPISFGSFAFHRRQRVLLEEGRPVRLGSRAFDILEVLLDSAGELVTKEDLIARVWPSVIVEESALRTHIGALRRALGDGVEGARYVVNEPGRGYRFVAPVGPAQTATPVETATDKPEVRLPSLINRVIGREDTLNALSRLLAHHRVVTLAGPGGIGKTTVAVNVARLAEPRFPDGIHFIDLGAISDGSQVPVSFATALHVSVVSDQPLPSLVACLKRQPKLLIIDNCEHVIVEVAALVDALLQEVPDLVILATSREPLRVTGERIFRLAPLELPEPGEIISVESAPHYSAIELFIERAEAASDSFQLTQDNLQSVVEICRRVDGLPLALELVAARMDQLGADHLLTNLDDHFLLSTEGARTALTRHRTLSDLLEWSFELLSAVEQSILIRLAIFKGGFTLEAAIAVASHPDDDVGVIRQGVLALVAKSLIVVDGGSDTPLFRMLQASRAYALTKLQDTPGSRCAHRAHALYHIGALGASEDDWSPEGRREWVAAHAHQVDDLRAALDWAFSSDGDVELGIRLTVAAVPMGFQLSVIAEFKHWVERALSRIEDTMLGPRPQLELNLVLGHVLGQIQGGSSDQAAAFSRALELADETGRAADQIGALMGLFVYLTFLGDYPAAVRAAERLSMAAQASADPGPRMIAERMQAQGRHFAGEFERSRKQANRVLSSPLAVFKAGFNTPFQIDRRVSMRIILARTDWIEGRPDQALALANAALEFGETDHTYAIPHVLCLAAIPIALWRGDLDLAEAYTDRLMSHAGRYTLGYWGTWGDPFRAVIAADRGPRERRLGTLSAVRPKGAMQIETLATLAPEYVSPTVFERVTDGTAGWCAAEVMRIEAVRRYGVDRAQGKALMLKALEHAERQGALAWKLRIACSIARQPESGFTAEESLMLLQCAHDHFIEGTDTRDLREARGLLGSIADTVTSAGSG